MGRSSDSKNKKGWIRKVGRTDPKNGMIWLEKWEGLTPQKWEGLTRKIKKSFSFFESGLPKFWGKVGRTDWKSEKRWLVKYEGLTLNMKGLIQNRQGPIQMHVRPSSKREVLLTPHSHRGFYNPKKSLISNTLTKIGNNLDLLSSKYDNFYQ